MGNILIKTPKTDWLDCAGKCIDRFYNLMGQKVDKRINLILDLKYSKVNVESLLKAPDGDFLHDMSGIFTYMDRENLCLTRCFCPRSGLVE